MVRREPWTSLKNKGLFLLFVFLFLGCRFAGAGELCEINFDKIVFLSGWTKSGKVQFVKANEEILGKADQLLIDTLWRWQQTLYNNDGFVKSRFPYSVHSSTKPVLSEPSTLRQAQGERWVEALSTNGISIG